MKITIELEIGHDTGLICGSLKHQADTLREAKKLGQNVGTLIDDCERLSKMIEDAVYSTPGVFDFPITASRSTT